MAFHSAAVSIRQAWRAMPEITEISENLLVEETPEGLDIQIVEQGGRRMFPDASKYPNEPTRLAIAVIAPILNKLPNQIRISGHTAGGQTFVNPRYGAWELSSDRANATRSILNEFGLSEDRVHSVVGRAAEEPYFANDPYLAANERVKITVLHSQPPIPLNMKP
jgi:chemotaxis protein MotB